MVGSLHISFSFMTRIISSINKTISIVKILIIGLTGWFYLASFTYLHSLHLWRSVNSGAMQVHHTTDSFMLTFILTDTFFLKITVYLAKF